ncbi:MAG: HYR domain-containing protein, partial [Nitrososphaera sp.]
LVVDATSESGATVTFSVTAVDDQDGEIAAYCSPSSGSTFPVGKVNVLCRATDKDGNTALASFVVAINQIDGENDGLLSMWVTFAITGIIGAAGYGGFRAVKRGIPRQKG